jgi:hypothetical protein
LKRALHAVGFGLSLLSNASRAQDDHSLTRRSMESVRVGMAAKRRDGELQFNNPVRLMRTIAAGFMPNGHSGAVRSIAANFWTFQQAKSPRCRA